MWPKVSSLIFLKLSSAVFWPRCFMFLKSSSRCCILFLNGLGQVLTLSTNLSTADGHENWVERVGKKYKTINCILIQRIAKWRKIAIRGTYVISFPRPSYALTLCVSNKKGKHEISEPVHESELKNPPNISLRSLRILIHPFSRDIDRVREWTLWLEMNDTLIISFQGFDSISAVSRKVLTLLESALWHFEVLRFLWQLSSTN